MDKEDVLNFRQGGIVKGSGLAVVNTGNPLNPDFVKALCDEYSVKNMEELKTKNIIIHVNSMNPWEWIPLYSPHPSDFWGPEHTYAEELLLPYLEVEWGPITCFICDIPEDAELLAEETTRKAIRKFLTDTHSPHEETLIDNIYYNLMDPHQRPRNKGVPKK